MSLRDEFVVDILELLALRLGIRTVDRGIPRNAPFPPYWRELQVEVACGAHWAAVEGRLRYSHLEADDFPER